MLMGMYVFNTKKCAIILISSEIKVRTSFFLKEKRNFCKIPAAITCSKSTIEVLEQSAKYVHS